MLDVCPSPRLATLACFAVVFDRWGGLASFTSRGSKHPACAKQAAWLRADRRGEAASLSNRKSYIVNPLLCGAFFLKNGV